MYALNVSKPSVISRKTHKRCKVWKYAYYSKKMLLFFICNYTFVHVHVLRGDDEVEVRYYIRYPFNLDDGI